MTNRLGCSFCFCLSFCVCVCCLPTRVACVWAYFCFDGVSCLQMQAHPWPTTKRDRGWSNGGGSTEVTQMRFAWLFNDPFTGHWTISLDYQEHPSNPIYQVTTVMAI